MNKKYTIAKLIFYYIIIMFIIGSLMIMFETYTNQKKIDNSIPPYIVENKNVETNKNNNDKTYIVKLKPVGKSYNDSFNIKVGQFTYGNIALGDTLYNIP